MWVFSAIGPLVPSAMLGVLGVAGVIAEIALLIAAIGAINQIPGFGWLVDQGGELLGKIGEAVGKLIGGFIGGTMEGISNSLPKIAENISQFMYNLEPFLDGVQSIDQLAVTGVKNLAELILILTGVELLNGIASWFTGGSSLVDFGKDLAEFAPYLKEYANSVRGLDSEAVENSANAGKMLQTWQMLYQKKVGLLIY